ncbi:MAG: M20/M25/M40 family metallo-hydrolase [Eubacteriales bacterium]|nr:M20/M25/M40 family metallo-hydrolase [Eubacteriales bacterium]
MIYPVDAEGDGPLEVFAAHMDVVFPDETELPLREEDGRIYCPGVGDDTACLVCLLLVAKYIAAHREGGEWKRLRPKDASGLLLVCNTGEEGLGNLRGTREICRAYGSRICSFCTFDACFGHIVNRAVGSRRYRVSVDTKGGHSFGNFGADNAIEKLSGIIQKLYHIEVPKKGHTTYNVGTITGGTSVNTIAQHAEMLYEYRSDTAAYLDYMEERFAEVLEEEARREVKISRELLGERPCGCAVDEAGEKRLVRRAVSAVKAATGKVPVTGAGSTDCNIPLSLGIPSVCVGCYEGQGAHTREEYVETASLKKGYRVAFDMILGYET